VPDLEANRRVWSSDYDWSNEGDEWSQWWGGSDAMWFGALLPRIHRFVPAGTILEIAPGYGRWTQYLKGFCQRLILVDMAPNCIDHCARRFANATNVEYHVNDGLSLEMVPDGSVDFAFSFDSLVHAGPDVIGGYIDQLSRKLTRDGAVFIHHSNLGSYRPLLALTHRWPSRSLPALVKLGLLINLGAWRDEEMSAGLFAAQCERAGMRCVTQESITWRDSGYYLMDTLSVFTSKGSRWDAPRAARRNRGFRREARRMASIYAAERS
jgi:hypothetical protein